MGKRILKPGQRDCPSCGVSWEGELIVETFIEQRDNDIESNYWQGKTDAEIEAYVKEFYSPPYRWGKEIGIEIQGYYDGISRWKCFDCGAEFDRWTGEEIKE